MVCPNPVAFTVFGHDIYWYGILMASAVVIAVLLAYAEAKRKGIDPDDMLDYALVTVPVAIVFARLYYVVFSWETYADNPISALYIWQGGIAVYGSIIGGIIATLIVAKWKKISFWTFADLVAPGLVLGQAIGRWGNFFNQEAYGALVTDTAKQFFPYATYIEASGTWHQATFFYESAACLLIFVILLIYRRRIPEDMKDGNVFLLYWILYGIERFFVEGMRLDSLYAFKHGIEIGALVFFPEGIRVSQALSLIMVVAFLIVLIRRYVLYYKAHPRVKAEKEEKVEDIAQVDPSLKLMDDEKRDALEDEAEEAAEEITEDTEEAVEEAAEAAEDAAEEAAEEIAEAAEEAAEAVEAAAEEKPENE